MYLANLEFPDFLALSNLTWDYFHSLDTKNWALLKALVAPTIRADYTDLGGPVYEALESNEFVAKVSGSMFSNPLLRTQHLLGGTKWEVHETHIVGYHQVRSGSRILASEKSNEVVSEAYRWVIVTATYVNEDRQWKLSGIAPKSLQCVELQI